MLNTTILKEGFHIFISSLKTKLKGHKKYKGNFEQISKQIIEDCWNGKYFQVSPNNYNLFYSRDFG